MDSMEVDIVTLRQTVTSAYFSNAFLDYTQGLARISPLNTSTLNDIAIAIAMICFSQSTFAANLCAKFAPA